MQYIHTYMCNKQNKKKRKENQRHESGLQAYREIHTNDTQGRFINRRGTMTGIGWQGQPMHLKRTKKSAKMETRGSSVSRRGRSLDRDRINPGQIEGSKRITGALLIGHRSKGTNGASLRAQISRCDRWKVSAEFLFGVDRTGRGIRRRDLSIVDSSTVEPFVSCTVYVGIFYYCTCDYLSIFVIRN